MKEENNTFPVENVDDTIVEENDVNENITENDLGEEIEIITLDKPVAIVSTNKFSSRICEGIQKEYPSTLQFTIRGEWHYTYDVTLQYECGKHIYNSIIGVEVQLVNGMDRLKLKDENIEREFVGDVELHNITCFPDILLPLEDERVIELTELDEYEKNKGLYNHLCLVREYYNDIDIAKIADFINCYVFDYPLPQKELDNIVTKVYSVGLNKKEPSKIYKTFDKFEEKETKWLFYPYIPLGSITILAGDPGCGKSNISVALASIISNGNKFPFESEDTPRRKPSTVIMQNGEDGIEDVIKPRLTKAGANHENIGIIVEDDEIFTLNDLKKLELVLEYKNPKLIIFDPIQRYMGNVNPNSLIESTNMLKGVNKLAQKYSCAILLVMHLNKGNNKGIYRLNGSVGLPGAARSVLMVEELAESNDKALIHIKSNLAKKGDAIIFEITDNGVLFKEQVSPHLLNINKGNEKKMSQKDIAKEFIKEMLSNGAVESQVVLDTALNERQISKATLERAKSELKNIKSFQQDGKWFWKFKDDDTTSHNQISDNDNMDI